MRLGFCSTVSGRDMPSEATSAFFSTASFDLCFRRETSLVSNIFSFSPMSSKGLCVDSGIDGSTDPGNGTANLHRLASTEAISNETAARVRRVVIRMIGCCFQRLSNNTM